MTEKQEDYKVNELGVMTEQMKYEAVASAIGMFQAALEKQFMVRGLKAFTTIQPIVVEFARNTMFANNLFPEMEKNV